VHDPDKRTYYRKLRRDLTALVIGTLIISLAVWLVELLLVKRLGVHSIIFFIGVCCLGLLFTWFCYLRETPGGALNKSRTFTKSKKQSE